MKRALSIAALALLALLAVALVYLLGPWGDPGLASHPAPAASYSSAVARIAAIDAAESNPRINPAKRSIHLLHGSQVETAVVLFHGYTSNPRQFAVVAKAYYDAGYNVWVPLMPAHGYANRIGPDLSKLNVNVLRRFADSSVDIADGLGKHVVVVGLSGGGSLAEWSLAERPDVAEAVAISPLLKPTGVPAWAIRPLYRATRLLDATLWWDPALKARQGEGDPHSNAYPRGTYRGFAAFMMLGRWATDRIKRTGSPAEGRLVVLANEGDPRLDGDFMVATAHGLAAPARLTIVRIPLSAGLKHDIIDPWGENSGRIREAYAWLARALGVPLPDPVTAR